MALFHITIEKVIVQPDNDHDIKKLLFQILKKLDSNELEKQMDSWLATLGKSVGAIEKVSEQVDSK